MTVDLTRIYLRAANVIRTNGLNKGYFWGRPESSVGIELTAAECPVCAAGALAVALYGKPTPFVSDAPDPDSYGFLSPDFEQAITGLVGVAGIRTPGMTVLDQLAAWNDAPERTSADVIAAFEAAAKAVA